MNREQIDQSSKHEVPISVSGARWPKRNGRALALVLVIGAICFGFSGCVGDGYVGVSTYPNYAPYYGYYGYGGAPYYGYGGVYTRRVIVRGRTYSGGYGRHHSVRHRHGGYRRSFSRSRKPLPARVRRFDRDRRDWRDRR